MNRNFEDGDVTQSWHLRGERLASDVAGVLAGSPPSSGLIFDASLERPLTWDDVGTVLDEAFHETKRCWHSNASIIYVIDGPSLPGHRGELRAILASALLGGMRSLAVEGRRKSIAAHAISIDGGGDREGLADALRWLITGAPPTGQFLELEQIHLGRPRA